MNQYKKTGVKSKGDTLVIASCYVCCGPGTKKCTGCYIRRYCSVECQRQDWKRHKVECGKLKEAGHTPTFL